MKLRPVVTTLACFGLGLVSLAAWAAMPPAHAKPLSAILAAAQQSHPGQIAEADFDHGRWEVTVCHERACQKLFFNASSGASEGMRKTEFEHTAPAGSQSIVTIVKKVEAANVGRATGVDFDHGHWKVELAVPVRTPR